MARTSADGFAAAIAKVLDDYKKGIIEGTEDLAKKMAQKGAKELQSASQFNTGNYAKGWTSTMEKGILIDTAVIYNKTAGLPHLLENGHAKRRGGRVAGRTHIAPVEEELVEEFTKAVEGLI